MSTTDMDLTYFLKSNEALYKETLYEFAEKNYDLASLNEIIKRSSFNKGSFYYRFSDKKSLYYALVDDINTTTRVLSSEDDFSLDKPVTVEYATNIIFENLYRLYCLNPLYLSVLYNISLEKTEITTEIETKCAKSIFSVYAKRLTKTLKKEMKNTDIDFLIKEIGLHYNEAIRFLPKQAKITDFEILAKRVNTWLQSSVNSLITAEILKPLHEEDESKRDASLHPEPLLSVNQGDTIAIFGKEDKEIQDFIESIVKKPSLRKNLRIRETIRENISILDAKTIIDPTFINKNSTQIIKSVMKTSGYNLNKDEMDTYLENFNLLNIPNRKLSTLGTNEIIFLNLFSILHKNPTLILVYGIDLWMENDKIKRFLAVLLKYRPKKCTIVLAFKNIENILAACNKFVFIKSGAIEYVADRNKMIKEYLRKKLIVSYLDAGEIVEQDFLMDIEGKSVAKEFIDSHEIVDITIHYQCIDNIIQ